MCVWVCVRACACMPVHFVCCLVTPKVELKEHSFLCFHKHSVRHLTLLIEALDLQYSYANYFYNLKIAVPTSAFSVRCIPVVDGEGFQQLEWVLRLRLVQ